MAAMEGIRCQAEILGEFLSKKRSPGADSALAVSILCRCVRMEIGLCSLDGSEAVPVNSVTRKNRCTGGVLISGVFETGGSHEAVNAKL